MFLNLDTKELERHIYRITTLDRIKELFELRKNVLVSPISWDDPYENYILRSKVRLKSGEIVQYNYHEWVYGQCWSLHSTSDAMWRIYAPDQKGVRIRTTVRCLAESLARAHPQNTPARCRVGRVRYLSQTSADSIARKTFDDYGIGLDELFSSLLVKRKAFTHAGVLGMSVARAWRGNGVGQALMQEALRWARESSTLKRIELKVYVRNAAAVHIYEKFGFEVEGRRRNAVFQDGGYLDDYVMALLLE